MPLLRTLLAALAAVLLATACVSKPPAPTPVDTSGTLHRARQAQDELSSESGRAARP